MYVGKTFEKERGEEKRKREREKKKKKKEGTGGEKRKKKSWLNRKKAETRKAAGFSGSRRNTDGYFLTYCSRLGRENP